MVNLTSAAVRFDEHNVYLSWKLSGEPPVSGHWTLTTTFTAGPNGPIDQLGFKVLDRAVIASWQFDLSGSEGQTNYLSQHRPRKVDGGWSLQLPRATVRSDHGQWSANMDLSGTDAGFSTGTY